MIRGALGSITAVVVQFLRPSAAYRVLSEPRGAVLALVASAAVIAGSGFLPAGFTDWEQVGQEVRSTLAPDLQDQGFTPLQVDSIISFELTHMREFARSFPSAMLMERLVIALVAALAAFGIAYAVEGGKVGRITDYVTSSVLSQAAYSLTASVVFLGAMAARLPGSVRLSLGAMVPIGSADPGRMHVFLFRFLGSFDIPSIVALFLWGTGLAVLCGRERGWGLRLALSVFLVGVLLVSLPVMFAPAAQF